jgi:hypothetical protein
MKLLDMFFRGKKANKYNAKKTMVDDQKFDSKKEAQRYVFLKQAQEAGVISNLQRQTRFELEPPVVEQYEEHLKTKTVTKERTIQRGIYYTCDFQYEKDDELVVEDVKSSPGQVKLDKAYQIRKKLLFARHGIKIKEIFNANASV